VLRGSADKIREAVGWTPRIPLERTLVDLLDYWRRQIQRQQR
jgi:nucleoside-diphosphate-sugar epimerase